MIAYEAILHLRIRHWFWEWYSVMTTWEAMWHRRIRRRFCGDIFVNNMPDTVTTYSRNHHRFWGDILGRQHLRHFDILKGPSSEIFDLQFFFIIRICLGHWPMRSYFAELLKFWVKKNWIAGVWYPEEIDSLGYTVMPRGVIFYRVFYWL